MIRVLQFADLVNRYDFIDAIVRRADRSRFEIGVCVRTHDSNIEPPEYCAATPHWVLNGVCRRELPRASYQLANLLRRWKVDILHTHHYEQAVIGLLATTMAPHTRLVVGRHYSDTLYRLRSAWKKKSLLVVEQIVNRCAARIVVPSQYIQQIVTSWQGIPKNKVDQVPYGFVEEKYAIEPADVERVRNELKLSGRLVVGNFGRLHDDKGQRFLIEAIRELRSRIPSVLVLIVGEGPERSNLEQQIYATGLEQHVKLLGWRRDAITLMHAVDVVVQPTLQEAFSQVMAEALWLCKPLVITDVGGVSDVITNGVNGLLVPKEDSSALITAIKLLADDAELRRRLGASGRAHVQQHLHIDKIISQYEQVYLRAMGLS
jgi:glycosyltransferase involved in cell wall biosynthesis